MTRDEIIAMAKQARVSIRGHYDEAGSTPQELARFAALVAKHEREACAQVIDQFGDDWMCDSHELAKIVRARGNT